MQKLKIKQKKSIKNNGNVCICYKNMRFCSIPQVMFKINTKLINKKIDQHLYESLAFGFFKALIGKIIHKLNTYLYLKKMDL